MNYLSKFIFTFILIQNLFHTAWANTVENPHYNQAGTIAIYKIQDTIVLAPVVLDAQVESVRWNGQWCKTQEGYQSVYYKELFKNYDQFECAKDLGKPDQEQDEWCIQTRDWIRNTLTDGNLSGDSGATAIKNFPITFNWNKLTKVEVQALKEEMPSLFSDDPDIILIAPEVTPLTSSMPASLTDVALHNDFYQKLLQIADLKLTEQVSLLETTGSHRFNLQGRNRAINCALKRKDLDVAFEVASHHTIDIAVGNRTMNQAWALYMSIKNYFEQKLDKENLIYQLLDLGIFIKSEISKSELRDYPFLTVRGLFTKFFTISMPDSNDGNNSGGSWPIIKAKTFANKKALRDELFNKSKVTIEHRSTGELDNSQEGGLL